MDSIWAMMLFPLALGLIGFLEPCSIGASLLFLKTLEGNSPAVKITQATVFTLTRALFIGTLGAMAALIGTAFLQFQRGGYVMLGTLYVVLGIVYLTGFAGKLMARIGPSMSRFSTVKGSAALAVFFGLNVPACSLPLLAAVLGSAAVAGASEVGQGFAMLALFGFGLSLPLLVAVTFGRAQRALEWLLDYSRRAPVMIGALFVILGAWSIYFGISAPWARQING